MDSKIIYIEYRGDISIGGVGVRILGDKDDFMTPNDFIDYLRLNSESGFKGAEIKILYGGIPAREVHFVESFKKALEKMLNN